jgi:hypothetical protein
LFHSLASINHCGKSLAAIPPRIADITCAEAL